MYSIGGVQKPYYDEIITAFCVKWRQKYYAYLDEERKRKRKVKKGKIKGLQEIDELRVQRKRVEFIKTELVALSDKYAQKAESLGKIQLIY